MIEVTEETFEPFILKTVIEGRGEIKEDERRAVDRKAHDAPYIVYPRCQRDKHYDTRNSKRRADPVDDAVEYFLRQGVLRMELHVRFLRHHTSFPILELMGSTLKILFVKTPLDAPTTGDEEKNEKDHSLCAKGRIHIEHSWSMESSPLHLSLLLPKAVL